MMKVSKFTIAAVSLLSLVSVGCSNGGGGGGSASPVVGSNGGKTYRVQATVATNTCTERLAPVNQLFTLSNGQINTSLLSIPATEQGNETVGAFSDSNGGCTRDYEARFSNSGSNAISAKLSVRSNCSGVVCETTWQGTGSPEQSKDLDMEEKVRGETCNPNVSSQIGFRPSLFECNGCAAVLMRGSFRNNYSVVVRRDGQYNDRDPLNPTCGTNACSPYKTQKRIELPEFQVNCLGDSGFATTYAPVNRISVKFGAEITNANDASQFEQYCLASTSNSLN